MSSEASMERKKKMEILRWIAFMGDIVVATVFVLLADELGDIAY